MTSKPELGERGRLWHVQLSEDALLKIKEASEDHNLSSSAILRRAIDHGYNQILRQEFGLFQAAVQDFSQGKYNSALERSERRLSRVLGDICAESHIEVQGKHLRELYSMARENALLPFDPPIQSGRILRVLLEGEGYEKLEPLELALLMTTTAGFMTWYFFGRYQYTGNP